MHISAAPGQQYVPRNSGLAVHRMSKDAGTGARRGSGDRAWIEVIGGGEVPAL